MDRISVIISWGEGLERLSISFERRGYIEGRYDGMDKGQTKEQGRKEGIIGRVIKLNEGQAWDNITCNINNTSKRQLNKNIGDKYGGFHKTNNKMREGNSTCYMDGE